MSDPLLIMRAIAMFIIGPDSGYDGMTEDELDAAEGAHASWVLSLSLAELKAWVAERRPIVGGCHASG